MTNIDTQTANIQESERLMARMKSYTGPAILIFFLYLLGYFPGLIANYLYRKEAKRIEHLAGQRLPGTGVINFMYWLNLINIPLVMITLVTLLIYAFGRTIVKQFSSWESAKELIKTLSLIGGAILFFVSVFQFVDTLDWRFIPEGSSKAITIFSPAKGDYADIVWMFRSTAFQLIAFGIISGIALFFGIKKYNWLQALFATLKNIWTEFRESLTRAWNFFSAGYISAETSEV